MDKQRETIECEVCSAVFGSGQYALHFVESHGFPSGLYPVCPYCEHLSETQAVPSTAELRPPRPLRYSEILPIYPAGNFPETRGLLGPAIAFRTTRRMLDSMKRMPVEVGWIARLWQRQKDEHLFESFKSLDDPQLTGQDDGWIKAHPSPE